MIEPFWELERRCSVRVPATSANLGPGFDSLGLALGLYDVVEVEVARSGFVIEVDGQSSDDLPRDARHLVVRSLTAALQAWGLPPLPGLRLRAHNAIPHGRGLGSSAGAVVAGIALADRLAARGDAPTRGPLELLDLATRMEGHPDNAAAALLGGLTVAWMEAGQARAARLQPHPLLEPVVLVPENRLDTVHARSVLPVTVPHADAAATAGRAALLVHALTGDLGLLMPATEDWLHQRQRAVAMPDTLALVHTLRDDGYPAVVSGAGPSVLVLCVGDVDGGVGTVAGQLLVAPPPGWSALAPGVAHQGTRAGIVAAGVSPIRSVLE